MMLIGAITPLLEFFDRWDAPGLSNDTELAVYAFVFAICLVLLLCRLVACDALKFSLTSCQLLLGDDKSIPLESANTSIFAVPPLFILPLRI
jgi:hypothetical protein